jgi:DNA polymerase-3 subunit chi
MTNIDFYFNAEDRLQVACRLAAKALKQGSRMLIYAPDADTAGRLDTLMWTWPATGFVPHCRAQAPLAAETPVLIASGEETPEGCELLLNLGAECPPHFERFARLLEVVSVNDEEKASGRSRYRFYKERGYPIASHDLAQAGEQ